MLALYRCGRQADALAAFHAARARFVEELGIEPGQPLRELHEDVLTPRRHARHPRRRRRRRAGARGRPQVAGAAEPHDRPRARSRRDRRTAAGGSVRLLTLTGPGRGRQDAARPGGRPRGRGGLRRRRALRLARRPAAARGRSRGDRRARSGSSSSPASRPTRRSNASWPPSTCCWWSTTSSMCWPPRRSSAGCSRPVRRSRSWPPVASRSRCRPRSATPYRRSRCPSAGRSTTRGRWRRRRRRAVLRARASPRSRLRRWPTPTPLSSRRSAGASTGCRWRSSWRPPAADCCPPARSPSAWTPRSARRAPAPATRPRASRRCARRSTGATNCSSDDEKQCFARFAVFAGGATVDGGRDRHRARASTRSTTWWPRACSCAAGRRTRPTRLGMLETIRAYATRALRLSRRRASRARAPLPLLPRARPAPRNRTGAVGRRTAKQHLARLDAEIDNLHAALGWAIGQANAELALALAAALGCYWVMRDRYADAVDWIDQALNLPGADAHPALRVRALRTKARCLWQRRARSRANPRSGRGGGHRPTAWRSRDPLPSAPAARRSRDRCRAARCRRRPRRRGASLGQSCRRQWEIAEASRRKAIAASSIAELRERVDTAASLLTDVGNVHQLAGLLTDAAYGALCLGSERDAADFAARATPIARALDGRSRAMINSGNLGLAALLTGETDAASHAFREELRLCRDMVVAARGVRRPPRPGRRRRGARRRQARRDTRRRRCRTPLRPGRGSGRGQARGDVLRARPHTVRHRAWNAAAREGSTLSFEDAIAYALEEPPAQIRTHRQAVR